MSTAATDWERRQLWLGSRIDAGGRVVARHWLALLNLALGVVVSLPLLAPLLMFWGWEAPAALIYRAYSYLCHQFAQRSWFLFGDRFTISLGELWLLYGIASVETSRRFLGDAELGWKMAWSDRMVSFYGGWFLFSLVHTVRRHRRGGLHLRTGLALMAPMLLDGGTHLLSDLTGGVGSGFRDSNAWLVVLTGGALSPAFYAGDAWGTFNSLMRLGTGLLAAAGLMLWLLPLLDRYTTAPTAHVLR